MDMLVDVCKLIFEEYPTEMLYLTTKDDTLHPVAKKYTSPITDNCHVWTANDTRTKKNILLYIFKEIGISPAELELELVPISDSIVNESVED